MNAAIVEAAVRRLNAQISTTLQNGLNEHYPSKEMHWMRAERLLLEPKLIHGLCGQRLQQHGREALNLLLGYLKRIRS